MTRIEALREVGRFMTRYQASFASLPRDADGKPTNIEIRKLLAVDPELSIALAALLAVIYYTIEHEARVDATNAFDGRG